MNDYFLVQFAKSVGKTTAQLTLSDMLKFNRWNAPESGGADERSERLPSEPARKFTRTNPPLKRDT